MSVKVACPICNGEPRRSVDLFGVNCKRCADEGFVRNDVEALELACLELRAALELCKLHVPPGSDDYLLAYDAMAKVVP